MIIAQGETEMTKAKKRLLIAVSAMIVMCLCIGAVFVYSYIREQKLDTIQAEALAELETKKGEYDDKYIVLYDTSKAKAEDLAELYGAKLRITENGRFARLELPEGVTIRDIYSEKEYRQYIEEMEADYSVCASEIETVEEEETYERYPLAPQFTVSDTDYGKQTYLNYLNMQDVWSRYTGSGITVAVIDTGIDTDHPEFAGRISEYSYNATEDKIVKDYTLDDGSYDWSLVEDEQGHGTAVTGVIAASMNSGNVVGIAPNVNIITIKAECDDKGEFKRTSDLVFGLYYAIEQDVNVVNMSFGSSNSNAFEEVLQLAYDSDVICVAAAGNDSTSALTYPAAYENCIGVGALADGSWELADYSNYGENTDIVAPGTTYSTDLGGGYKTANGTSLSAPIVTGAIALLMQTDKYMTFDEVTELLYASAYEIGGSGPDWDFGYGALDVNAFVQSERGTVTFNMLTDELENTEQVFIKGNVLQDIPEPERNYSVFDGWYYDDQCTEEFVYYEDVFADDVTLYAKWANEDDGIPYTYVILNDGTVEIRSYTGKRRFITIPEKIDGRVVSSIGDHAFADQTRLREIGLPSGLTNIGSYAFENCANLVTVEIPAGVTRIGEYAFSGDVRLSTIAFIGNSKLTAIENFAFESCGRLEKFELPASLESVNGSAFYGTTSLISIDVRSGNRNYVDVDGVLFNKSKSIIVAYPAAHGADYDLPEGVTTVGHYSFAMAKISSIDLDGIISIQNNAFVQSSLKSVNIPDSVTELGGAAFEQNLLLSEVHLGKGIVNISSGAFWGCSSLEEITIPNSIVTIDGDAFRASGLTNVDFESNSDLVTIGARAFSSTNLSRISIPDSVIEIGEKAFAYNYNLSIVNILSESNLNIIGFEAFANDYSIENIELPGKLHSIGEKAFMGSGLAGTILVPASVTEIGNGAFASCSDLSNVDIADRNTVYHDINGVVYTLDNTKLHTYPAGKSETTYFVNESTVSLMPYSFTGSTKLVTAILPTGLEQISERAFNQCTSLQYINIPDNVTQIGRYSFAECWNLSSITFNETSKLPRISYGAFAYSGITSFTVPANVSTMAQYSFEGCRNLTSITFAENSKLESISAYMFDGCDNLETLTFSTGSSLSSVQAHGLEGMTKIQKLDFSNTKLTNIDNFAFRFCESLSSVTLTDLVTNIGRYAFYGCESMSELSVPAAIEHIGPFAFLGTTEMNVYFAGETLPLYVDEYWDHGIEGYYLGVTSVTTSGDFKYATMTSGGIGIIEYTGTATELDLTACNFGGNITIIGGSAFKDSTIERIVIPETVTTIQAEAFAYSALKSVTIPQSVQFIGREAFIYTPIEALTFTGTPSVRVIEQHAFEKTTNLKIVTIPASVEIMGTGVFSKSGLTEVVFADGIKLEEIPQKAFNNTKLETVTIPDSVSLVNHNAFNGVKTLKSVDFGNNESIRIMSNAFYQTGLTSLHIPANVTYIGEYAFVGIKSLKEITVDEANPNYKSEDGLLLNKTVRKLINVPAGREGSLVVPTSVEEIGFGAFEESKLSSVTFDANANILTFGYRAFFKAENITEITIPASVVSIDYYAFAYCKNLETVTFAEGNKLKGIYEGAFCGNINLKNITIPDSVVEISDFAFYGCSKLTKIPITETTGVKGIYDYAFAYSGISGEFTLPEQIIDVGDYAFLGCDFTKVTVPDTNAKQLIIGLGAFEECNKLEEITLPFIGASYENMELSWFGYIFGAGSYKANDAYVPDSLKKVIITDGVSFVGAGGFYGITTVEEVEVPHSVQTLYGSKVEEYIKTSETSGYIDTNYYGAFSNSTLCYKLTNTISVAYVDKYGDIDVTKVRDDFGIGLSGNITIRGGTLEIGNYAFEGCINLNSVIFPDSVTSIGSYVFKDCSGLVNISFPQNVTSFGGGVFWGCSSITNVTLPDGVSFLDGYDFYNCSNLQNIDIPNGVTLIGAFAFYNCNKLMSVNIPEGVTSIEAYSFFGCSSLGSVKIPSSVTTIEKLAFDECSRLYEVYNYSSLELEIGSSSNGYLAYYAKVVVDKNGNKFYGDGISSFNYIDTTEGFRFILQDGKYKLISYLGDEDTITLPTSINGRKYEIYCFRGAQNIIVPDGIESIGDFAFNDHEELLSVILPESITSIGQYAFGGCSRLKNITIYDGVISIDSRAFLNCVNLEKIVLPDSVTSIGDDVFLGCSLLTEIKLSKELKSIGVGTFERCYSLSEVTIPDGVRKIERNAFKNCSNLSYITIPNSVTSIENEAFLGCVKLVNVTIPDSVISIGKSAFAECTNLNSFRIPKNVNSIGGGAFSSNTVVTMDSDNSKFAIVDGVLYNKSLTEIITVLGEVSKNLIIPNGVTTISYSSFIDCNQIETVIIPESVISIKGSAFKGCSNLYSIYIPQSVTSIGSSAFEGCTNLTNVYIPESVTSIGQSVFKNCANLTEIKMPDSITWISDFVFEGCTSLNCVNISDSVTHIGYYAFKDCISLNAIDVPNSVTRIRDHAFKGCVNLKEINIPSSVTIIDEYTFDGCTSLYKVVIADGVTEIGIGAFSGCVGLSEIYIPESVMSIGSCAFYDCNSLINIEIPLGVKTIGYRTFYDCDNLKSVIIPDSVTDISKEAFHSCSKLTNIRLSENLTTIGDGAFHSCSILSITLPEGITSIGEYAFYNNKFSSITIPNSIESIGNNAFFLCDKLYEIHNHSSLSLGIGNTTYGYISAYARVVIDREGNKSYRDESSFFERIETADNFVFIYEGGIYNLIAYLGDQDTITLPKDFNGKSYEIYKFCGAKNVIVPDSILSIGKQAFYEWSGLETISISNSVISIGDNAFSECDGLECIVIPDSVTSIGEGVFSGCENLKYVTICDSVTSIGKSAFKYCSKLKNITISKSITSIGVSMFEGCSSLESVNVPDGVASIGSRAFEKCSSLRSINISGNSNIVTIGDYAFKGCSSLESVSIPKSVTSIGVSVFEDCNSIYNNQNYYLNGILYIDDCLLYVDESIKYLPKLEDLHCLANGVFENCQYLKNAIWPQNVGTSSDAKMPSNVETIYITNISSDTPCLKNIETLKNIIICDSVDAKDFRNCINMFTKNNISDVTIYVEELEKDLRWDDNFPGWNNGNKVVYGDKWNWVKFCDEEGNILLYEPKTTSQIVRLPAEQSYIDDDYVISGWDVDRDGIEDVIPAIATEEINAVALIKCTHKTLIVDVYIKPTCTENGFSEGSHCYNCGEAVIEQTVIEALGHDIIFHEAKNSTCTEIGWNEYENCSRCDYTTYSEIEATGHSYGEWYIMHEPTCTEQGTQQRDCTRCDQFEMQELDAIGHDLIVHIGKAPTCTEFGWNQYETCSRCDYTTYEKIAETGHSYESIVTEATCTLKGYTIYTCHCGDSYVSDYVDALGHNMSEWNTALEPTCEEEGTEFRACESCGYSEEIELEALGHDLIFHEEKGATCTAPGHLDYEECNRCDHTTFVSIPMIDHNYENGACTMCGEKDPTVLKGDIDGDGKINAVDMFRMKLFIKQLLKATNTEVIAADINNDGKITAIDLFELKYRLVKGEWLSKED